MENIILIGFMGSGKTTIGTSLAKRLQYDWIDVDQKIEKDCDQKISDIFSQFGEEYFRDIETMTIYGMLDTITHSVISTGGGLPMRSENAGILKELGLVVMLNVTEDTVIERLKGDRTRPLLQGDDVHKKVHDLLTEREPKYKVAAHVVVDTNGKTVDQIVDEIISCYQEYK